MTEARDVRDVDDGYDEDEQRTLAHLWGDGFMSPGGVTEVARILGNQRLDGAAVLDVGSGLGAIGVLLATEHGAETVVGIELQADMVATANERAAAMGVADRVGFRVVEPDTLPFADASFDVVFSKDSIVHVQDKRAFYGELRRLLRPGGRLLVGDWLGSADEAVRPAVDEFVVASGGGFSMMSIEELTAVLTDLGFVDIETEDRHDWYLDLVTSELERLRSDSTFQQFGGEEAWLGHIVFWEHLVAAVRAGALRPGHVRARRPG